MKNTCDVLPHYLAADDFYAQVKKCMKGLKASGETLTLVTLDFDHFNYVNDLFGYETGDLLLEKICVHFSSKLTQGEFFSKIHADHFAFCVYTGECTAVVRRFLGLVEFDGALCDVLPLHYSIIVSGGLVVVQNNNTPLSSLLDKANYARKTAKGGATSRFLFYDEKMADVLEWQKAVTLTMEEALHRREFEMYLQPKVLIQNDKIVGAEALARWNSPQYGLIGPDRFIPIMEQNGFVCQLDFFILKEACAFLRLCTEMGKPVLPISVNFSKAHLTFDRVVDEIFDIVTGAGIATNLIEIEFTESLFAGNFEKLIEIMTDLKLRGFHVSLDDFGSAYSSLNCLKDLPIDIVKIDKGFLNASANSEKGKLIIAKTVELIKSLRKISVMEGIENFEQVEFMGKLCCDLGQGYFYAKPMPIENFLEYLSKNEVQSNVQQLLELNAPQDDSVYLRMIPKEFQMNSWELYTLGKNIDIGLMKGYLDSDVTVQYVNDCALEYLGYTRQEFYDCLHNSILAFTHPDDRAIVRKNVEQLIKTGKPLSFQTRAFHKNGREIVLKGRVSSIIDSQSRHVGIYVFQDVTDDLQLTAHLQQSLQEKICELESTIASERQMREAVRINEERYRVIMDQSNDIMFEWDFDSDFLTFSSKYSQLFGTAPITQSIVTNTAARAKIHPDDLAIFEDWVVNTYQKHGSSTAQFRVRDAAGEYVWVRYRSSAVCDEEGRPIKAVGVFSNITAQKQEIEALTIKSQMDSLTMLLNKEETRMRIDEQLKNCPRIVGVFFLIDIDNFKGLNDNLGHQMGDTVLTEIAHKLKQIAGDHIIGRIGGDEFVVFLQNCDETTALPMADRLSKALRMTYYGSVTKYDVSGSIGIAFAPSHACTFSELYRFADIALYESKRNGKDCFTVYHANMTGLLRNNQTPVEWSESFLTTYFQNDFPFQIFQMMYETREVNTSIRLILELLGKRYKVDRVYVFQFDSDGEHTSNTFEWCAPGVASQRKNLQGIPLVSLQSYFQQYSREGVLHCTDLSTLDPAIYEMCVPQGIQSMLHCAIYNEGNRMGFIGFDMCNTQRNWSGEEIAILGYISRILSVFLIKTDTATELRTSYQNYVQMLENLNGYVYVIDAKTYEMLYVNSAMRALNLTAQGKCYQIAFGANKPCENCPMKKFSDTVHYSSEEIYSEVLDTWVNSAASKMKWEGVRDAVLVSCTDIAKYKNNELPLKR